MSAAVRYRNIVADSARWEGFAFRPGDIVISTPSKSGTTWTQMICALLIFQTPAFARPLGLLSPWLDMLTRPLEAVLADLDAQRHRRFIKSHTPLDGLPFDGKVTYICVGRDPRDVALSFGNHMANMDPSALFEARRAAVGLDDLPDELSQGLPALPDSEIERFWQWVDDPTPPTEGGVSGMIGSLHHLSSFWEVRGYDNVILLHYDELQADLEGQMRRLADLLGIAVPADRWPELVRAATFSEMRRRADDVAPETSYNLWRDNQRFFNQGSSGQWRRILNDSDLRRYDARVRALAAPDLSAWVHRGPILA